MAVDRRYLRGVPRVCNSKQGYFLHSNSYQKEVIGSYFGAFPQRLVYMIELPENFVTGLVTNANSQITNFSDLLLLIMGVLLAVTVIGALIAMLTHR